MIDALLIWLCALTGCLLAAFIAGCFKTAYEGTDLAAIAGFVLGLCIGIWLFH